MDVIRRHPVDPPRYGVALTKEEFTDELCRLFELKFADEITIDELLLHPRSAMEFCDDVRHAICWHQGVPDDVLLRALMQRRKNPKKKPEPKEPTNAIPSNTSA